MNYPLPSFITAESCQTPLAGFVYNWLISKIHPYRWEQILDLITVCHERHSQQSFYLLIKAIQ